MLPLVHVKSRLFGNSLISTGFTVGGGPLAEDRAALDAVESRAVVIARQLHVEYIEYRSGEPVHSDWATKSGLYAGFCREIDPDLETNMRAIPRKQRAMVRKGIKAGLIGRLDTTADTFHRIYGTSVRNLGTPVFPKKYFESLLRVFGDDVDIVTITHADTPVASVMNFHHRGTVMPYYGGGTGDARSVAANDFMYWDVMRRACERGEQWFDFGRSKIGTGAYSFKKNWGFEPRPWIYEYNLLRRSEIPEVNPLNPKYRLFIAAWRRLPLAVANSVGPFIARSIG